MRAAGRFITPIVIFALLLGTAWTDRASVVRVDIDPALGAGDIALLQVAPGTAWTVADDLIASGATEVAVFDSVSIVSARVSEQALSAIATDRAVLRATTDAHVSAIGGDRSDGANLDAFGLDPKKPGKDSIGIDAIDAPSAWSRSTGAGVVVALMDSGIGAHPDLPAGKVVARANFARDNGSALDPAGHGTHLAGIIAASGATFRGVAPDARLVDIRVLDANGDGTLHGVVAGFDWLLKNRGALSIRVLNLSLGTRQRSSYHDDLLAALAEAAWFSGIAVVAAAGNDGPVPGTIATPGADPFIITAGSFDDQGTPSAQDDRESAFSSRAPTLDGFAKPDVLAPGRRVVSLRATASRLELTRPERVVTYAAGNENGNANANANANKNSSSLYIRMSGTSVSSAMVSGVAALVLSVHADYTPTKTKGALVASGRGLTGSVSQAVTATTAITAAPRAVNAQLLPSKLLMTTLENSGVVQDGVTWDGMTWEGVTWEAVTWESVSWESVTWESVTWEGVMSETVSWEQDPLLDSAR